ncbi:hypothetical protein DFH08DRAFT_728184 [Mycena albidolilacea]|uniref:Arrestin-like N-terminal domain-containing protein n=1 Tax=Mycena albidolilacea TaxID=1033008 RepID=A0AAD7AQT7_9AGAR|nr:hypothetical protein DFH08DRAFT_728184 [Mycena albidolilacea]
MSSPPVYERGTFSVSASLPAYSPRPADAMATRAFSGSRGSTEHIFALKDKKNKTWATLTLASSAPAPSSLPTYLEGDKITGSLSLNIPANQKIAEVSIIVRGEIIPGPQQQNTLCFLDISVPLWSKNQRGAASPSLSGEFHWPFSIDIPRDVVLADPRIPGALRTYILPQTFLEKTAKITGSAHYYLLAKITRSALLFRDDAELRTMFVYVPALRPDPPSLLRQLAYQENTPIPGPEIDAEGWHTCPAVTVKGTVFNNRTAEVQCVFSLSKPLSYTRGGVIPCSIDFFCRDLQALNLLCTPISIDVRLYREVKCSSSSPWLNSNPSRPIEDFEENSRAVWWQASAEHQGQGSRRFEGEIHLARTLKPTSLISHFTLTYFVLVMPFEVTGFLSADTRPLIRQEVDIATICAKGPRPRCYAPRGSD